MMDFDDFVYIIIQCILFGIWVFVAETCFNESYLVVGSITH